MRKILAALLAIQALLPPICLAEWQLNGEESHLNFVSIKNGMVAEVHRFDVLSGAVDGVGRAIVNIGLASVETNIPIRNDRMKSMLFDVDTFALATASTELDLAQFSDLATGGSIVTEIALTLDLHGITARMPATVKVTRTTENVWQVVSLQPLVLNAATYNLTVGLEALRAVAGLNDITAIVPVTFNLEFTKS